MDSTRHERRSKSTSIGNAEDALVSSLSSSMGPDSGFSSKMHTPRAVGGSALRVGASTLAVPGINKYRTDSLTREGSATSPSSSLIHSGQRFIPAIEWSQRKGFICLKVMVPRAVDITVTEVGPIRHLYQKKNSKRKPNIRRSVTNYLEFNSLKSGTDPENKLNATSLITIQCSSYSALSTPPSETGVPCRQGLNNSSERKGNINDGVISSNIFSSNSLEIVPNNNNSTQFIISFHPFGHLKDAALTAVKAAVSGQYFRLFFNKEKKRMWPRLTFETKEALQSILTDQWKRQHQTQKTDKNSDMKLEEEAVIDQFDENAAILLPHTIQTVIAKCGAGADSPIRPPSEQRMAKVDISYDWSYEEGYLKNQFPEASDDEEESPDSDLSYPDEPSQLEVIKKQEVRLATLQRELKGLQSGKTATNATLKGGATKGDLYVTVKSPSISQRDISRSHSHTKSTNRVPSHNADAADLDRLLNDDDYFFRKRRGDSQLSQTRMDGEDDQPLTVSSPAPQVPNNKIIRTHVGVSNQPANNIVRKTSNLKHADSFAEMLKQQGLLYSSSSDLDTDGNGLAADNTAVGTNKRAAQRRRHLRKKREKERRLAQGEENSIVHSRTNSSEQLFSNLESQENAEKQEASLTPDRSGKKALEAALAAARIVNEKVASEPASAQPTPPTKAYKAPSPQKGKSAPPMSSSDSSTDVSSLNSEELEEDFSAEIAAQVADEQGMRLSEEFYHTDILRRIADKKRRKAEQTYRRMLRSLDANATGKGSERYREAKREEAEERQIYKVLRMYARLVDEEDFSSSDDASGNPSTQNKRPKKSHQFLQAIERRRQLLATERELFSKRIQEERAKLKTNNEKIESKKTEQNSTVTMTTEGRCNSLSSIPQIHPIRAFVRGDWWNANTRRRIQRHWAIRTLFPQGLGANPMRLLLYVLVSALVAAIGMTL